MMALPHDMIGMGYDQRQSVGSTHFALERLLGRIQYVLQYRPVSNPFVADFATTTAANGKT